MKGLIHHDQVIIFQHILINVIHQIKKMMDKNHRVISIDAEKASDKIQHRFMNKNS